MAVLFLFRYRVIRSNRVSEMVFGLFHSSGLSVFTSSHFREEGLAEKMALSPAYAVLVSDLKVTV